MRMKTPSAILGAALSGLLVLASAGLASAQTGTHAAPRAPSLGEFSGIPVTGTCTYGGTSVPFSGTLTVKKFTSNAGKVVALGTLSGSCAGARQIGQQSVALPTSITGATCQILNLVLGPLHLDLLGLVVNLSKVHLVITAQSGPGNLLGNLLCDIAHLLDGGGSTANIVKDLNKVLAIVG
jgi:hypothetical protein